MNPLDYWAIAERDLEIQNPISADKLALLDLYCDVKRDMKVVDVGCGKGTLLRRWAKAYGIVGTGLDINAAFIDAARSRAAAEGVAERLEFVEGPAEAFDLVPGQWDVALCLGASFALGGFVGAVDWLARAVHEGGSIVLGDLTLTHRPNHADWPKLPPTLDDCVRIIGRHGFEVVALVSASAEDFEHYASAHHHATMRWAAENPGHPQAAEVLAKGRQDWEHYLANRPYFGWTMFVARRDGRQA